MYTQGTGIFWYTTRLPPSAIDFEHRLQHCLRLIFWDVQEIYLYFFFISYQSECFIHHFYLVVWFVHQLTAISSRFPSILNPLSLISLNGRPETASEFESACRVRWIFKVQQDYFKVRAQIENTHSNRFLGGGCQGNGFLNHNCRGDKNNLDEAHQ